jgi:hypothetical protein
MAAAIAASIIPWFFLQNQGSRSFFTLTQILSANMKEF